jgi:hypothetical protein
MKAYLGGPMSQFREEGWNRASFDGARARLLALGHTVCSPMMVDDGFGGPDETARTFPKAWLLALDVQVLATCEAVVLLPGWEKSVGTRLEVFSALTFGIALIDLHTFLPLSRDQLADGVLSVFESWRTAPVVHRVMVERRRQDQKWGPQNHPDSTGLAGDVEAAEKAKAFCDDAFRVGMGSWRLILEEEVREAFAETDPERLEKELVEVAAVAAAWIEAIRRRSAKEGSAAA